MLVHVLNGDSLADKFPFKERVIVFRECLIDGPVAANSLSAFWAQRASFIAEAYNGSEEEYFRLVVTELEKLHGIDPSAELALWFEHDLFCQVNLWFVLHVITDFGRTNKISLVYPPRDAGWEGFGNLGRESLAGIFAHRLNLDAAGLQLGQRLWKAYSSGDADHLKSLGEHGHHCFPRLKEVVDAHLQRMPPDLRPHRRLKQIMASMPRSFEEAFSTFQQTEGIYGFGDSQVRRMIDELA